MLAAGVSLGGNALMRWAEEAGAGSARALVSAVASICAPLDLAAGGAAIGRGFNRLVYTRMFLSTHEAQGAGQAGAASRACSTASRCWRRATSTPSTTCSPRRCTAFATPTTTGARGSAKPHLHAIRIPALVLNATQRPVRAGGQPAAPGRGRRARHAVAAGARRARRLPAGRAARPCARHARARRRLAGAASEPLNYSGAADPRQNEPHGRHRQTGPRQVAQRAALLRLAGPGCARQLVHARRPHAGHGALPGRPRARCSSTTS